MKCMAPLMTVSRFPPTVAVTVTLKGEPADTVRGAVNTRIACVVPQPNIVDTAIPTVNAPSRSADSPFPFPSLQDLAGILILKRAKLESIPITLFGFYSNTKPNTEMAVGSMAEVEIWRLL